MFKKNITEKDVQLIFLSFKKIERQIKQLRGELHGYSNEYLHELSERIYNQLNTTQHMENLARKTLIDLLNKLDNKLIT